MSFTEPTTIDLICECKPCPDCEGEGQIYSTITVGHSAHGLPRTIETSYACRECEGTGLLDDDCEIHCAQPVEDPGGAFDPRYGITADQVGHSGDGEVWGESPLDVLGGAYPRRTALTAGHAGLANPVCPACDAGDHEQPKMAACTCACHQERRAA